MKSIDVKKIMEDFKTSGRWGAQICHYVVYVHKFESNYECGFGYKENETQIYNNIIKFDIIKIGNKTDEQILFDGINRIYEMINEVINNGREINKILWDTNIAIMTSNIQKEEE